MLALPAALAEVGLPVRDESEQETRLCAVTNLKRVPENAYYIGRGCQRLKLKRSKFCNPYKIGTDGDRHRVVSRFRDWILTQQDLLGELDELRGKLLLCHCEVGQPCHGIILLQLLARGVPGQ